MGLEVVALQIISWGHPHSALVSIKQCRQTDTCPPTPQVDLAETENPLSKFSGAFYVLKKRAKASAELDICRLHIYGIFT